jgi:elongation factor P
MAQSNEIYRGMIINFNNEPHVVVDKEFYSPGKGGAFNRVRMKNIKTGKIFYNVFKSGEKVEELEVQTQTMQYLYADNDNAYFMDPETFEQMSMLLEDIPGKMSYLHESGHYVMTFYQEKVIFVQMPSKITLTVTEAPDGSRGNTATNATKEITLETGLKIQAPLFIKVGDKVSISTETGTYSSKDN